MMTNMVMLFGILPRQPKLYQEEAQQSLDKLYLSLGTTGPDR